MNQNNNNADPDNLENEILDMDGLKDKILVLFFPQL